MGYVLCMPSTIPERPEWDRLYETAAGQSGYVTTKQAAEAGYSTHLLRKHMRAGRVMRPQRGIYRLVHFPSRDHEEFAIVWLWSAHKGVFSHQTALSLHDLSDLLPTRVHLTFPQAWRRRRFRVPSGVVLHHADVAPADCTWFGPVPATGVARTLSDCAKSGLSPDLLRQATEQALRRGRVKRSELADVETALRPFGGLEN